MLRAGPVPPGALRGPGMEAEALVIAALDQAYLGR